jgi:hypothetical protein
MMCVKNNYVQMFQLLIANGAIPSINTPDNVNIWYIICIYCYYCIYYYYYIDVYLNTVYNWIITTIIFLLLLLYTKSNMYSNFIIPISIIILIISDVVVIMWCNNMLSYVCSIFIYYIFYIYIYIYIYILGRIYTSYDEC